MSSSVIDSLSGLDHAKQAVRRILSSGSGVHAVMFYGAEGAGKATLARYLAKCWMCPSPREDGTACDECNVCKSMDANRAVDYQQIAPWGASSFIKLRALRYTNPGDPDCGQVIPVLEFFRTRPLMGRNKVVVFERVDRMHSDMANAFLKTLEEPGDNAKLILTTHEFSRVLPTIRSRCMCVACELPERAGAIAAGDEPIESVFGGSPGGVAHVRENMAVYQRLFNLLESSRAAPLGAAFRFAEEVREIAGELAKSGLSPRAANTKVVEAIASWLAREQPEDPEALRAVAETHRRIQGNAQPGIAFEDLFLGLLYHG